MRPITIACAAAGLLAASLAGCASTPAPKTETMTATTTTATPPIAAKRDYKVTSPAGTRNDEYYWLRDDSRKDPDVIGYLEAENAYKEAMLAHVQPLENKLYDEMIARIKQDDASVPYRKRGYWYYSRFMTGSEYPVFARKAGSLEAAEQVMLDVNVLAKGFEFFQVGAFEVSPNDRILAYAEDSVGRRQWVIRFKDLVTGETLPDRITNAEAGIAWAADNRTVFYTEKDPETLLGFRVRRHVLGTDAKDDPVVYEEQDKSFYTGVGTTKDDKYIIIVSDSTISTEMRYADAADPAAFKVLFPRERDHEYDADHLDGRWIIRTNWQAPNFRLMEAKVGEESDRGKWREVLPHRADAFIHGFDVFKGFLAISERSGGLRKIRIRPLTTGEDFFISSDEAAYTAGLGQNAEIDTEVVRYTYTSLTTPNSTYDYNIRTGEKTLLKRDPVLGDFDPANYTTEFAWATARDGQKVPVSIVYRKGFKRDGTAPLMQYAYGSYGISTDPAFSVSRLSLLDRGFVYAIAHIRGGQEMGRRWYDDGRLLRKQNTFTDFIDVTRFLVQQGYADPKRVFASGGSAGGLLIGAVANLAPGDYRGLVAHVPFVDVVTTMLDESIPLTTNEFDEWGNPKDRKYYEYMLSYSPYDNVAKQDYPAMLVTTGLWDSQVQYYEPAKWVARLRARKTDSNPLLFRTTMEAGHGGKSGRFQRFREVAEEYSFVLDQAGIRE
ncbi:MAG: S9 family peptidase [Gammaproteobacteria bacterium]|nr:S9 family peptidase [Gammaproteobacteria bacterium]